MKKKMKKTWKKITSPEAKKAYSKAAKATFKNAKKANKFLRNMSDGIDDALGTDKRKRDFRVTN